MNTLAKRLGMTIHVSVLEYRLRSLLNEYPSDTALTMEDWLVDMDDARFIVELSKLSPVEISKELDCARIPAIPEIREQFGLCKAWLKTIIGA